MKNEATAVVQYNLTKFVPNLAIDGVWGAATEAAWSVAPVYVKTQMAALFKKMTGISLDIQSKTPVSSSYGLLSPIRTSTSTSQTTSYQPGVKRRASRAEIDAVINRVAKETGVDASILTPFVDIESKFNNTASNGSSRGLFQIQPPAWNEVKRANPQVPNYNEAVWDPYWNTYVGAKYMALNTKYLRSHGYTGPITPQVLYLAHQQGAAGFTSLWNLVERGKGDGSVITDAAMLGNPPQDGKGRTTNKVKFYNRWVEVANKKFRR